MHYIKYIFLLLLSFGLIPLYAQVETVNIPFDNPAGSKKLKIDLFQSSIKIKGTDRSDVLVRYQITDKTEDKHHQSQENERAAGLKKISGNSVNIEMSCQNNTAIIHSNNWHNYIAMVIEVPRNIELNIHKKMGDTILIEKIHGNINIENNIGDIIVKDNIGIVNASTNVGNIVVDFAKIPEAKSMIFNSTSGEIDLTLPNNYSADLKMKSEMGEIYSDLDMVIQQTPANAQTRSENGQWKYSKSNWTYASLQQGGPSITINSKIGNIYLRKK